MSRRAWVVVSVVALLLVGGAGPASSAPEDPARAKPDYIAFRSEPGDPLGHGARRLFQDPTSLSFDFTMANRTVMEDVDAGLRVVLQAPIGQNLVPGSYSVPSSLGPATASNPAFSAQLFGISCVGPVEFTVLEYDVAGDGRLAIDFRGWCGSGKSGPSYSGSGRYRATPPTSRAVAAPIRLAGSDRIDTAIRISQDRFPSPAFKDPAAVAGAVVLARSDLFADSLGGSVLAAEVGGPILLTPPTGSIDPRTLSEINRVLDDGTVFVLGGVGAISAAAEAEVEARGHEVVRVAGADRFETAAMTADLIEEPQEIYLVTGRNFPDGLAAAAIAAARGQAVILLTDGSTVPPVTSAWMAEHDPALDTVAIGGPAAQADATPLSIVGTDRYDTALKLALTFGNRDWATVGLASGETFADALAGSAHIGALGGPLLLTPRTAAPQGVRDFISSRTRDTVIIYGGSAAVAPEVDATL